MTPRPDSVPSVVVEANARSTPCGELVHELGPRPHVVDAVDGLHVVVRGVRRLVQRRGDLLLAGAGLEGGEHLAGARPQLGPRVTTNIIGDFVIDELDERSVAGGEARAAPRAVEAH